VLYKEVKNDRKYFWTSHSKYKLVQYGLGPSVIKRVIRRPDRVEEGIAPDTVAVMKDRSTKSQEKEVWVMYQKEFKNQPCLPAGRKSKIKNTNLTNTIEGERRSSTGRIKIISAWIYPGKTKKGKEIFIPDDVLEELQKFSELITV